MADGWVVADTAEVGYKTKRGDWIVMVSSCGKKGFRITKTTRSKAICELPNRHALKFPRYYTLPYQPLEKKAKPDYQSPNSWHVRVNKSLKHLRLRYD